jgi:hypothetical protein
MRMLKSPLSALRKGFYKMGATSSRRIYGPRKNAISAADALAGTWLEYRYGLMPAIYQADEIAKFLAEQVLASKTFIIARGGVKLEEKTSRKLSSPVVYITPYVVCDDWQEAGAYASIGYKLPPQNEAAVLGFKATEVLPAAYELTTLSFVADWFVNLGDFIAAIQPSYLSRIIYNTVSMIQGFERSAVLTGAVDSLGRNIGSKSEPSVGSTITGGKDYLFQSSHLIRVVNSVQPASPVFNPRLLGVNQELDSLALLWSRFPSFLKKFR